jgi:hypothetical protein
MSLENARVAILDATEEEREKNEELNHRITSAFAEIESDFYGFVDDLEKMTILSDGIIFGGIPWDRRFYTFRENVENY